MPAQTGGPDSNQLVSACRIDRDGDDCKRMLETGLSMAFETLWLLFAAVVTSISLMVKCPGDRVALCGHH